MYNPESTEDRQRLGEGLISLLQEKKFKEEPSKGERVFSFPVDEEESVRVMIYTSVVGTMVRAKDKDAIRVVGVYESKRDGKVKGLVKVARVYRTGKVEDIINRTMERARKVWKNLHVVDRCRFCDAPMFLSKKENLVCAELCFLDLKKEEKIDEKKRKREV